MSRLPTKSYVLDTAGGRYPAKLKRMPCNSVRAPEALAMYPTTYFGLFPAFPRDERGFVAMSFDPKFDSRWTNVIARAISAVGIGDIRLTPHRVDLRSGSDSILTEILDGIARCRVFVADITAIGEIDGRAVRNANVLYEVGLAHAVRQPEEVIVLRSDDRELGFDIANVRVHRYDPDGSPDGACKFLGEKIIEALKEVDLKKNLAVRRAVESLDYRSWMLLAEAHGTAVRHPSTRTVRDALSAIARAAAIVKLLDMGALRTEFVRPTEELLADDNRAGEEMLTYRPTAFGTAILAAAAKEQGMFDPEMQELMKKYDILLP